MTDSTSKTINLLSNGEFTSRDVSAGNVGDLRNELEIPTTANVNVGGTVRQNDFAIQDGAYIAYTSNNKVGGSGYFDAIGAAIDLDMHCKKVGG